LPGLPDDHVALRLSASDKTVPMILNITVLMVLEGWHWLRIVFLDSRPRDCESLLGCQGAKRDGGREGVIMQHIRVPSPSRPASGRAVVWN